MLVRFLRSRPRYRIRRGRPADAEGLYAVQERAVRVLGRQVYNDSQIESWVHGNSPQRYVEAMRGDGERFRSEEHTSELQSLMRSSYAVFCLKKKKRQTT